MDTEVVSPDLITFSDEVPTTRPAIEAIADRLGEVSAVATAQAAVAERRHEAAARILLAGMLRDERPPAELALSLAPYVEDVIIALRLAVSAVGDRVGAILSLCDSERLSTDREAALLFLAIDCLEGAPVPPALRTRVRLLARRRMETVTRCLVGHVALATEDEDVLSVAEDCVQCAQQALSARLTSELRKHFKAPLRSVLPERPPEEAESGYTIQRDAPKVGRNDPCGCGSGKKYKRCCGSARTASPHGALRQKRVSPYRRTMTWEQFEGLRSMELVRLDPTEVATEHLVPLMRGLANYHFFDEAEGALTELAHRSGDGRAWEVNAHRSELLDAVLVARELDVARRLVSDLPPTEVEDSQRLALQILEGQDSLLATLESMIEAGLRDERRLKLFGIAYTLLEHSPALGLVFSRGVVHPRNALDSLTLLETMDNARDRLLLSPDEAAWDLYEKMEEIEQEARFERRMAHANVKLAEEVEELRAKANEEAQRRRALQSRLREQESALVRARAALEADPEPKEVRAPRPAGADIDALREKVADLKSLLRSSTEERRTLRRKLAAKTESLEQESEAATDVEEREPEGIPEETPGQHAVLLPQLGERFESSLADLPAHIARDAVRSVGALAAGDSAAWRGVKRMRSAPKVRSARLSIAWRMLFTVDLEERRLHALVVVHRSNLDQALAQYR